MSDPKLTLNPVTVMFVDTGPAVSQPVPVTAANPLPVTIASGGPNSNVNVAAVGGNATAVGGGALTTGTQRTTIADQYSEYETVAASQTAQVLGVTGGTGDYVAGLLVVPATTSPGQVLILDNATSITLFTGGASSVSNLVPFLIPLGLVSVSGAWKVTTGANVSVIGIGNFT